MVASDRISAFDFVLDADPRQGRDPHPDVAVVVRAARRPGAAPRRLHRRARRSTPGARWSASGWRCTRSSAWPAATSPAPAWPTTAPPARSAASPLPAGLVDGSRLPEPIFTPATKAAIGEHDENVSYDAVAATVGADAAAELRDTTLAVYAPGPGHRPRARASSWPTPSSSSAATPTARLVLADEVLTPDSSRFWPADEWQPGRAAAVVRQAVRARLADLAGVRLGPRLRRAAAAAAGRGRRAHPGALRRGLRAAHRPDASPEAHVIGLRP